MLYLRLMFAWLYHVNYGNCPHCLLDSVAKHLEYANTMFSFIWWVVGFYWVTTGGESLTHDAPQLYWYALGSSPLK